MPPTPPKKEEPKPPTPPKKEEPKPPTPPKKDDPKPPKMSGPKAPTAPIAKKPPAEEGKSKCEEFKADQTVFMMCKMLESRDATKAKAK